MAMPAPPTIIPDTSRADWTVDELAQLPDDGNRYEVLDGALLVTPAPSFGHQRASIGTASARCTSGTVSPSTGSSIPRRGSWSDGNRLTRSRRCSPRR